MVRAILDGTKTQTRRMVSMSNSDIDGNGSRMPYTDRAWEEFDFSDAFVDPGPSPVGNPGPYLNVALDWAGKDRSRHRFYPKVWPGDRLWVKETHAYFDADRENAGVVYRESDNGRTWEAEDEGWKWKPSLFMPRKWSRITLEIVSVRVERLNAISEEDAWAEGIQVKFCEAGKPCTCESNPVGEYADLWESINGPGSWVLNPFVWVISFRKL